LKDVEKSIKLCKKTENAYLTIGCGPARAHDVFDQELWGKMFPLKENISKDDKQYMLDAYFTRMRELIKEDLKKHRKIVAIGGCGLGYDVHYKTKTKMPKHKDQMLVFLPHFDLAKEFDLPMFFNMKNCGTDMI
jgi:Tat protein secretion system quality control protein TatD with DNase activity